MVHLESFKMFITSKSFLCWTTLELSFPICPHLLSSGYNGLKPTNCNSAINLPCNNKFPYTVFSADISDLTYVHGLKFLITDTGFLQRVQFSPFYTNTK